MTRILVKKKVYKKIKQPVVFSKYWYDPFYKIGRTFNCTNINYEYKEEYYIEKKNGEKIPIQEAKEEELQTCEVKKARILKALPEIYESYINKLSDIRDNIIVFFKKFENYNNTSIYIDSENNENIIFSCQKEQERDNYISSEIKNIKILNGEEKEKYNGIYSIKKNKMEKFAQNEIDIFSYELDRNGFIFEVIKN